MDLVKAQPMSIALRIFASILIIMGIGLIPLASPAKECRRVHLINSPSSIQVYFKAISENFTQFQAPIADYQALLPQTSGKLRGMVEALIEFKTTKNPTEAQLEAILNKINEYYIETFQAGFEKLGLTNREIYALRSYTGDEYKVLNTALRTPSKTTKDLEPIYRAIDSGLLKLPLHQGTVLRGTNLPKDIADQHQVGTVVTYPSYTSTSIHMQYPGTYQFKIESVRGRLIDPLSQNKGEGEVLFPRNSRFEVLSRENVGDKIVIHLQEL